MATSRWLAAGAIYQKYLNATPRQGAESLRNWPDFRLSHLLGDSASSARQRSVSACQVR